MAIDRDKTRDDIAFLRRRPHRPESVSNASESSQPTTGGLNLARPSGTSTASTGGLSLGTSPANSTPAPKLSFDRPNRHPSTGSVPISQPTTGGLSLSRPAEPAPTTGGLSMSRPSNSTPSTGSLSLGPSTGSTPAQSGSKVSLRSSLSLRPKMDSELPKHSVPYFHDNTELSLDSPVVRLDFRQSGIGSLVIYGAQAFAWETKDMQGGLQVSLSENSSDIEPPSFGNRKLAEFVGDEVVVGLRHAHKLRRLVIASQVSDLKLTMYDGSEIYMPSDGGNNVMLISRIGHELEVRMEKIDSLELWEVFSIKLSHVALTRS